MSLADAIFLDPHPFNVWIACRTDGIRGSGTLRDPYNGSTPDRFDSTMNSLPAQTRIHLGPGTFRTRGYSGDVPGGWQPKAGQQIIGSGIDVTTLQLVDATAANAHYFAIGHALHTGTTSNLLDLFELAELTIDCNLDGNGPSVACGAVRIMGHYARIRRVKAIHWGSQTNARRAYVFAAICADSFLDPSSGAPLGVETKEMRIEACVAVSPGECPPDSRVIIFHAGAIDPYPEPLPLGTERFGRAPVIRHCFVDCGAVAVDGVGRPQFCALSLGACRGGVVEGNQVHNTWFGGPYQEQASTRSAVVRNNYYRNVVSGPFWNLGASGQVVSLFSLERSLEEDQFIVTAVRSQTPSGYHYVDVGDRVKIDSNDMGEPTFKGVFRVSEAPDLVYHFNYPDARADRLTYNGPAMEKIFSADKLLIEGNVIELADFTALPTVPPGTPGASDPPTGIRVSDGNPAFLVTPDYVHGDVVIRRNILRIVGGRIDQAYLAQGIRVEGAKSVALRDNILTLTQANPMRHYRCGTARYFNNRTRAGVLLRGTEPSSQRQVEELEDDAENALLLALFQR